MNTPPTSRASLHPQEEWIRQLYEQVFPVFAQYVALQGGQLDEAREVFQESVIVLFEKRRVESILNEKGYLFGICKHLYRKHVQEGKSWNSLDGVDVVQPDEPRLSASKVMEFLKVAGERCLEILQSFYYEKLSMDEVASRFGFGSERSATVQKYKCLEKVREEVKNRSLAYEDFTD